MKTSNTPEARKILLYELVGIIEELYPNKQTDNPYFEASQKQIKSLTLEEQLLFHKLLHVLTILNKQSRLSPTGKGFETAREDIINVLHLFKPELSENPQNMLLFLDKVKEKFKKEWFSKKDLHTAFNIPNRTLERYIHQLLAYDMLLLNKGKVGVKHLYQINETPLESALPKENGNDIFDGFEDFKDNDNIDYQYKADNYRY